jgi:glyoxylase-like metal-dependent hydrolase (beta-lactamase superfamily II)
LSHYHADHIKDLDLFDDLPFYIHEKDGPALSDIELYLDAGAIDDEAYRKQWRQILQDKFRFKPRKPAGYLKGGHMALSDHLTVNIIHTPGHTQGHTAFYFEEPGVCFLGDYDLTEFGPWYGDRSSNIADIISSVHLLRNIPAKIWITGHGIGLIQEHPKEAWTRYLNVILEREQKLLAHLLEHPYEGQTMEDLIYKWIVYGKPREPKALYEVGEKALVTKHLQALITEKVVVCKRNRYRIAGNIDHEMLTLERRSKVWGLDAL